MKRKRKKLLALVTALSLVMSLLGVTAFAEEEDTSTHAHDRIDCAACDGSGTVQEGTPCTDCDGTGKVPCAGTFTGKLTGINSKTYEGTMTYDCQTCKAKYSETLSAEDTWNDIVDSVDISLIPTDKNYRNEQPRTNSGAPLYFRLKFNSILFKSFPLQCSASVQFDEHILDNTYLSSSTAKYDPDTKIVSISSVNFNSGVNFKMLTTQGTGDETMVSTHPGDTVTVTGTVTLAMGDMTQDFPVSATVRINKFPVTGSGISLVGLNAAVYPAPTPSRNLLTATSKTASLENMPGGTFDFASIFSRDNGFKNSEIGESVTNQNTSHVWTCVGFVPCSKYTGTADDVKEFVLDEDETEAASEGFTLGTLEDARQYVADHFGVLYGAEATDENLQVMVDHGLVSGTSGKLAIVWYVAKPQEFKHNEYGDLTIPSVTAAYQPTSQGVEIKPDLDSVHAVDGKPHTFEGELTVTIGSSAPNTIHINLSDALTALMGRASHLDNNAIQPGDVMNYHVKLVNNSGKDFQYVANSAFAATVDRYVDGQQSLGTGFDGYEIAASIPDGGTDFCAIPRRVVNDALAFLGADWDHLSDADIGALLKEKGYGAGEDMTDAEITQQYLAPFYLDYLNSQRAEGAELAHSFLDLTPAEFSRLTNYDNQNGYQPGELETCETVAQAFYYFYYGVNFTVNGVGLYDQMKDHAHMNKLVADALSGDGTYTLSGRIAGETTNNAFQNTAFGFGMQFGMEYTADPGPGPGGRDDDDPKPPVPVDIPEDPIPLDPGPGEDVAPEQPIPDQDVPTTDLSDEEVPRADVPKTGDAALLWLALSGLSGAGLAVLTLSDRRKKNKD